MAVRQGEPHGHQETHQDAYARFVAGITHVSCLTTRMPLQMCNKRATPADSGGTGADLRGARDRPPRSGRCCTSPKRGGGFAHLPGGDLPTGGGICPRRSTTCTLAHSAQVLSILY